MGDSAFHPEDRARSEIDRQLLAAGWLIQSRAELNLGAGLGVAVREFPTQSGGRSITGSLLAAGLRGD